ncbi:hypothetical protein [Caulobacter soli]|uniref:hypothetical protein n=1 Tax=Caulobacter soli TaxID=2708539 RepID=UPI0013EA6985|nr:hypothetical protein [Caulobacter soli]
MAISRLEKLAIAIGFHGSIAVGLIASLGFVVSWVLDGRIGPWMMNACGAVIGVDLFCPMVFATLQAIVEGQR